MCTLIAPWNTGSPSTVRCKVTWRTSLVGSRSTRVTAKLATSPVPSWNRSWCAVMNRIAAAARSTSLPGTGNRGAMTSTRVAPVSPICSDASPPTSSRSWSSARARSPSVRSGWSSSPAGAQAANESNEARAHRVPLPLGFMAPPLFNSDANAGLVPIAGPHATHAGRARPATAGCPRGGAAVSPGTRPGAPAHADRQEQSRRPEPPHGHLGIGIDGWEIVANANRAGDGA